MFLQNPDIGIETVADLIERLQRFPPNAPVAISDSDTDWHMRIEFVGIEHDEHPSRVLLGGDYTSDLPPPGGAE